MIDNLPVDESWIGIVIVVVVVESVQHFSDDGVAQFFVDDVGQSLHSGFEVRT